MRWNTIIEHWPAFVAPIMQRWPLADEDDLIGIEGDRVALTRYIAERHELTPAEAEEQVAAWLDGALPADIVMDDEMDDEQITASGAHIPPGEDVYSGDGTFGDDAVSEPPVGRSTD